MVMGAMARVTTEPPDLSTPADLTTAPDLSTPADPSRPRDLSAIGVFGRRVRRGNPVLLAVAGATCISSSAILVRLADSGAATTAFYRCLLALPFLAALALIEQRRLGRRAPRARFGAFVAASSWPSTSCSGPMRSTRSAPA